MKISSFLTITKEEIMRYIVTLFIGVLAGNLAHYYSHIFGFFKNIDYILNAVYISVYFGMILIVSTIKFLIFSFKEKEAEVISQLMLIGWCGEKNRTLLHFGQNLCMDVVTYYRERSAGETVQFLPEKYDIFSRIKFFLLKKPLIFKSTEGEANISVSLERMGLVNALVLNGNGNRSRFWQNLKNY